ncbi:MAG: UDP-N-acetylmuramate--L-alanine ligase [Clostridia bacterium]|nr:UDP-N-acetylmuramate--L-alanine ligase [Clostridia bacterium]
MVDINDFSGKRVHMIGIGGSSMSGLVDFLLDRGCVVTGSDRDHSHHVEALEAKGIRVFIGHRAENVRGADLVVFSAAIRPENPERAEAARLNIPQMERSVLLGELMRGCRTAICVSGTHGKTTTTAMIGQALVEAGLDPSVHLGGELDALGGGTRLGGREVFVAEACEYHSSFLEMHPTIAVILNVDGDHYDYYKDIDDYERAFGDFLRLLPEDGVAIANGGDARALRLLLKSGRRAVTFGLSENDDYYPAQLRFDDFGRPAFDVMRRGDRLASVQLAISGDFTVLNALAAFAACMEAGADAERVAATLSRFGGVHRRFELTGIIDGVRMYHDYGHNPAEMAAAISVAKKQKAGCVWAVMQPHTYSRVKSLFDDYLTCTAAADKTLVTDICAARESDPGDINSRMLVDGMRSHGIDATLTPSFDDTERYLRAHWQPGDLVLTMGCGDINLLNEQMTQHGDTRPES